MVVKIKTSKGYAREFKNKNEFIRAWNDDKEMRKTILNTSMTVEYTGTMWGSRVKSIARYENFKPVGWVFMGCDGDLYPAPFTDLICYGPDDNDTMPEECR